MLTLSETQWAELKAHDLRAFVEAVCDQYLLIRPEQSTSPGHATILKRMEAAHDYALRIGFTSNQHIVRWLYLEADAPGIHEDRVVDTFLRKPGATPEQRLNDMLAVVMNELKELEGSD